MVFCVESKGLITREEVKATIKANNGMGIRFILPKGAIIEADINNLHSTQRNTVLSKDDQCLCLTEHFLAACALKNLNNIDIELTEEELPFGDGSAQLWIDAFNKDFFIDNKLAAPYSNIKLSKEIIVKDPNSDKYIKASPADAFQLSYTINWNHPQIGKQCFKWHREENIEELSKARTFSSEAENQMLGLSGWIVGLTEDSFTMPLHFKDEPARHKALDLIGDLMLSGINPLNVNMHIESYMGGHELNSKMAMELKKELS